MDNTQINAIRHGELLLLRSDEKIGNSKVVSNYVVSHSETGHHHIVEGDCAVLERDGKDTLIELSEDTNLKHVKSYDRHDDIKIPKGIWRCIKKREYDPFQKVMREVWD